MNNSNNPLRLNVGYLYNKPIGTVRDVPVNINSIRLEDLLTEELRSMIRISKTREGLLLQVEGEALVEAICVRCLDEFLLPVEFVFDELYQFPSRYREDTDLILPMDGYIDLRILYREYLILAMPIKPVCSDECKGLCAICGANLNEDICEHHPELNKLNGITESEEAA